MDEIPKETIDSNDNNNGNEGAVENSNTDEMMDEEGIEVELNNSGRPK